MEQFNATDLKNIIKKSLRRNKKRKFFYYAKLPVTKFFFIFKRINFSLKKPPKKKFVLYDTNEAEISCVTNRTTKVTFTVRILN